VLGFGYGVIQHALDAPATLATGAGLLALVALGKIVTTSTTIGSGGSAGVFGPSMVIGGCAGGAVGLVLNHLSPELAPQPGAFVVVGMAGFFAGIAKTPISSLVMVSEITGSYSLLIPSMWVCVLTFAMSRGWKLYSKQVASPVDSPAHQGRFAIDVLRGVRVAEGLASARRVEVLRTSDPLSRVVQLAGSAEQATLPVLDPEGDLVGVISLEELRSVMNENLPEHTRAQDLMLTEFPRLSPADDLAQALRALASTELEELPVWDGQAHALVGLISRKYVTRAYVERMAALQRHQG
jgi:CIC family chloride channel protein